VDDLVKAMHCPAGGFAADRGVTDISKSQVSRLCVEIDERVDALLDRPLEGEWPYLGWTPATSRCGVWGGIVSVAAIVAVAVNLPSRQIAAQSPVG